MADLQEVRYEGDIQVRMDPPFDADQGEGHTAHGDSKVVQDFLQLWQGLHLGDGKETALSFGKATITDRPLTSRDV